MNSLKSSRLTLIPLTHEMLCIWQNQGRFELEKNLALFPNTWEVEKFYQDETKQALRDFWIPQTKKYRQDFFWYTNWEIILTEKSCSVGGIGLSGLPNNEGETEIGYFVDQKFRENGIATEAVHLLKKWAFLDPDLIRLKAETPENNIASQRILLKNNFTKTGEKTIFIPEAIKVLTWNCTKSESA